VLRSCITFWCWSAATVRSRVQRPCDRQRQVKERQVGHVQSYSEEVCFSSAGAVKKRSDEEQEDCTRGGRVGRLRTLINEQRWT
jgi:hypothetical protein